VSKERWTTIEDALRDIHENGFPEEPVALSDDLMASLSSDQEAILDKLSDLIERGTELARKIEAQRIDGSSSEFDQANAPELFAVRTANDREELNRVIGDARDVLGEALLNGLSHLGIVQRVSVQYGLVTP
jgi:hypothetical protein